MARYTMANSKELELREGALGCLASTLVLIDLIVMRVQMASGIHPALLNPALEDLERTKSLVAKAQCSIVGLPIPLSPLTELENAAV